MSTPTLCATVDLIFSQSSSCLGGITPGCPFRPLGKERGGQTTGQSFQIGALYDPSPPAAGLCCRQAGGARSCRIRRENDKTRGAMFSRNGVQSASDTSALNALTAPTGTSSRQ